MSVVFWGIDPVPTSAPETDSFRSFLNRYRDATLPALLATEAGAEFLDKLYRAFVAPDGLLWNLRESMPDLNSPADVPLVALDALLAGRGFDSAGVPWSLGLGEARRRTLGVAGVDIWLRKGQDFRRILKAAAAARVVQVDWHAVKDVVGAVVPLIVLDEPAHLEVFVHATNPEGLDTGVMLGALSTVKPVGRTVTYQPCSFLDDFMAGLGLWNTVGATSPEDGHAVLAPVGFDGEMEPTADLSAWTDYELHVRASYKAGEQVRYRVREVADGFEVRLNPAGVGSTLELRRSDTGALLATSSVFDLSPAYVYSLRVAARTVAAGVEIRASVDEDEVLVYSGAATFAAGGFSVRASDGDEVTLWRVETRDV